MRQKYVFALLAIMILLGSTIFTSTGCRQKQSNLIRVGVLKHESSLPIYIAQAEGYFGKHGIEVKLIELPPGDHLPALLAGRVDVISPTSFPMLFGIMAKNPSTLYAVIPGAEVLDSPPVYGIVVSKSFRGSSILDLRRKIVMAINPYTKVNILTILLKSEMPKDQWPEVKVADRQVALKAVLDGTAQAAIMDQPALATALETKDYRLLEANPRAKYIGSPYWSGSGAVLVTVWTERRDEFRRFFEALDEAIFYIRTNTESAHEILAQSLGLEKKIAVHCGGYYFPTTKEAVPMDGIRDTMKALVEAGLLESSFPVADFFPSGMYGRK